MQIRQIARPFSLCAMITYWRSSVYKARLHFEEVWAKLQPSFSRLKSRTLWEEGASTQAETFVKF